MTNQMKKSHTVAGTLAAFAAVVAVAAAQGPSAPPVPSTPTRTAVVVSAGVRTPVPPAAEVLRVGSGYEAQGAVVGLIARGYTTIVGLGPEARSAIEQARSADVARPGVRLIGR